MTYSWLYQVRRLVFIPVFALLLMVAACDGDEATSTPPPAETTSAAPTLTSIATDSPILSIGSGPAFVTPIAVAVTADGMLVVTDVGLEAVVQVDPATGNRTIISDANTGSGP